MGSWKTTSSGIASIAGGIALIAKAISDGEYSQIGPAIVAIMTGVGLVCARDNDKSSEQVGAKK